MTEELREKVAALRALAPDLNAATDEANAVVKAVERLLGEELSLGLSACSSAFDCEDLGTGDVGDDDNEGRGEDKEGSGPWTRDLRRLSFLAYGRLFGTYQIHILDEVWRQIINDNGWWQNEKVSSETTAWSSCSREVRLEAITKLPELLGRIADHASEKTSKAAESTRAARELLEAIGTVQAAPEPAAEAKDTRPKRKRGE